MSKTFKSALDSPVTLEVERETHPAGVYLSIGQSTILLAAPDAPALALAILEAAGYKEHSKANLGSSELLASYGMTKLRQAVQAQEREESEARERAELEAEALELANAAVIECGNPPYPSVERMGEKVLRRWLAVARRARELAKEATK